MSINIDLDKFHADCRKRESIICPYCDKAQSQDKVYQYITYYGHAEITNPEDELCDCEFCERQFRVIEDVTREYETEKIGGDPDAEESEESQTEQVEEKKAAKG